MPLIGQHLIAELHGMPKASLEDLAQGRGALREALLAEGYTILQQSGHSFAGGGGGYTCLFLLSESHASLHSYPEFGYLAFDLFSCGPRRPEQVLQRLCEAIQGQVHSQRLIERCAPPNRMACEPES